MKTEVIYVRVDKKTKKEVEGFARAWNLKVSEYVRRLLTGEIKREI